jgi:hypothetical protein
LHCIIPASSFEMHLMSISNTATAQDDINKRHVDCTLS